MKKVISILLFVFIIFMIAGCDDTNDNKPPDTTTETTTENTTTPEETISLVTTTEESTKETTTEPLETITENPFYFEFEDSEEEFIRYYKAEVSGRYRFDFGTDNTKCNYEIELYGEKNDRIFITYYSSGGYTCDLSKGKTYKLVITQHSGFPKGWVKIGIPNEEMTVENNEIKGQFTYTDQQNIYKFHSNLEGLYHFDFLANDVTLNYEIKLIDEVNSRLFYTYYSSSSKGTSVRLSANSNYKIYITQHKGFPYYEIKIHEPLPIESVYSTFSGEISFREQENIYEFTPKEDGDYKVNLNFGDKERYCELIIKDDVNNKLLTSLSESVHTINFEKGRKYKFIVEYGNGFLKYDVNIEKFIENETQ